MPKNSVGRVVLKGCTEVYSNSKHWPCLFPQHGPGKKHDREIKLEPWQQALVDIDPRPLIEGLIHSDGCRVLNWVNGTPYPRPDELPVEGTTKESTGAKRGGWRSDDRGIT
jgi:hypothetical protein